MISGECPCCGERHGFVTSCLCPCPSERCPRCDGYLDGGMPGCSCGPLCDDDWADREERKREWQARDAADGRDW